MDYSVVLFFLIVVLFGSYFQSVTGFAMGMIIVSVLGGLRVLEIPLLTAVISLLTILNVLLALRGQYHLIDRRLFFWLGLGQVPAIFFGLTLDFLRETQDSLAPITKKQEVTRQFSGELSENCRRTVGELSENPWHHRTGDLHR